MSESIIAVINTEAGGGVPDQTLTRIKRVFAVAEAECEVTMTSPRELVETLEAAAGERPGILAVGGGDGTLNAAAQLLADSSTALGVLPLGTVNNFATDAGIPRDVEAAIEVIIAGRRRAIDLGRIAGRYFLNNASIGVYPHAVKRRETLQKQFNIPKFPAMLWAVGGMFARLPHFHLTLELDDGAEEEIETPFIFFGNNRYIHPPYEETHRERLDEGVLSVVYGERLTRLDVLGLAWASLFGRSLRELPLKNKTSRSIAVAESKGAMRLSVDGEISTVKPPFTTECRPGALEVIYP